MNDPLFLCSDHPIWLFSVSEFAEPAMLASPELIRFSMCPFFVHKGVFNSTVEEKRMRFLCGKDAVGIGGKQGRIRGRSKGSVTYRPTLEVAEDKWAPPPNLQYTRPKMCLNSREKIHWEKIPFLSRV